MAVFSDSDIIILFCDIKNTYDITKNPWQNNMLIMLLITLALEVFVKRHWFFKHQ